MNARAATPAVAEALAAVCDGAKVIALDVKTGKRVWEQETDGALVFPAAGEGMVCYAAADGTIRAIDAKTGKVAWTVNAASTPLDNLTFANGMLYGRTSEAVIALDAKTGKKNWSCSVATGNVRRVLQVTIAGRIIKSLGTDSQPLIIADGGIHMLAGEELICLDAKTGQKNWQHKLQAKTDDEGDAKNREVLMRIAMMRQQYGVGVSLLAICDGMAYAAGSRGLVGITLKTGQQVWELPAAKGGLSGRPILADGVLYFGIDDGTLSGVRLPRGVAAAEDNPKDDVKCLEPGLHALRIKAETPK
jgi:outer membrane protein assembly factor BamB